MIPRLVPWGRGHNGSGRSRRCHPESLLVLYLETEAEIDAIATRIAQPPVVPTNPYWRKHALAFEDSDGFQLLLTLSDADDGAGLPIRVEHHIGPREDLRSLFELAEDSPTQLASYVDSGRVLVAVQGDHVLGLVQLTETELASEAEIRSMAVVASHRRRGIGRALVGAAIGLARDESRSTLVVATAAADRASTTSASTSGWDSGCTRSSPTRSRPQPATTRRQASMASSSAIVSGSTSASLARLRAPPSSRIGLARHCAA